MGQLISSDTASRAASDASALESAGVPLAVVARSLTDETQFVTTNDGVPLAYDSLGRTGPVVVLVHGWSGSRHYFELNARPLAKTCRVYSLDLRFHGDSGRPTWVRLLCNLRTAAVTAVQGYHVSRLAADLRDFLDALDLQVVTVVGTSMGAAVIWSYLELFGDARIAKAVFVDQAPLQNQTEDWKLGSKGCYDAASLAKLQCKLELDFPSVAEGNLRGCVSKPLFPEVADVLTRETLKADPGALSRLMADHTQLDWRPLLPRISVPSLNVIGGRSGIFPIEGTAVVRQLIPHCHTVTFTDANHWLYLEEPEKFNKLIRDFVVQGLPAVAKYDRL